MGFVNGTGIGPSIITVVHTIMTEIPLLAAKTEKLTLEG